MSTLTGISSESVEGSHLNNILDPWGELLSKFSLSSEHHFYKQEVDITGRPRWMSLHKAAIPTSLAGQLDGQVILIEDVTELQQLEQELYHSERLASVGRLAAGVAHEIGNPVTGIACLAQNMKFDTEETEVLDGINQILSQTDRVSRIVQSLVSFSHAGQQNNQIVQTVSLRECAQEAINLISLQIEKQQVNFINQLADELIIYGDTQRMIQVFLNLLSNSLDASPDGGQVIIAGMATPQSVTVTVEDEGEGIPSEIQDRVLDPFFTTKEPGEGTGLGLALVYSIIEDHEGQLEIVSPSNKVLQKGTKFVIKLPLSLATMQATSNTTRPDH